MIGKTIDRALACLSGTLLALGIVSAGLSAAEQPLQKRPNILWIVAENVKLDFGCYGAKNVATPHVDSLAARGTRYTRVFSTAPACATSRSAFMTGMYQTTTDTHHMRSHRSDDFRLPPGERPITRWLKDAGVTVERQRDLAPAAGVGPDKLTVSLWLGLKPATVREKKKRSSVEFVA